jgi:hypothetical protein
VISWVTVSIATPGGPIEDISCITTLPWRTTETATAALVPAASSSISVGQGATPQAAAEGVVWREARFPLCPAAPPIICSRLAALGACFDGAPLLFSALSTAMPSAICTAAAKLLSENAFLCVERAAYVCANNTGVDGARP